LFAVTARRKQPWDTDARTWLRIIHTRTNTFDYTGNFMTWNNRERDKWEIAILDHQIAVADAAGANTDQHLPMTWYGDGSVLKIDLRFRTS